MKNKNIQEYYNDYLYTMSKEQMQKKESEDNKDNETRKAVRELLEKSFSQNDPKYRYKK